MGQGETFGADRNFYGIDSDHDFTNLHDHQNVKLHTLAIYSFLCAKLQ